MEGKLGRIIDVIRGIEPEQIEVDSVEWLDAQIRGDLEMSTEEFVNAYKTDSLPNNPSVPHLINLAGLV